MAVMLNVGARKDTTLQDLLAQQLLQQRQAAGERADFLGAGNKYERDIALGQSLTATWVNAAKLWKQDNFSGSLELLETERSQRTNFDLPTPKLDDAISAFDRDGSKGLRDFIFSQGKEAILINSNLDTIANRDLMGMDYSPTQLLGIETAKADKAKAASALKKEQSDIKIQEAQEAREAATAAGETAEKTRETEEAYVSLARDYQKYQAPLAAIDSLFEKGNESGQFWGVTGPGGRTPIILEDGTINPDFDPESFDLYSTGVSGTIMTGDAGIVVYLWSRHDRGNRLRFDGRLHGWFLRLVFFAR